MQAAQVPTLALLDLKKGGSPRFLLLTNGRSGVPTPTPDTVYAAASLSKQITAALVLDLVDEGKLALDAPLGDFATIPGQPAASRATARMLLSHSSGFPNWRWNPEMKLEVLEPRKWRYSGEGYVYLQRVLEAVSKQPFGRYARQRIFDKLGMSRTSFGSELPGPLAVPHSSNGEAMQDRLRRQDALLQVASRFAKSVEDLTVEMQEQVLQAADPDFKQAPLPDSFPVNAAASLRTTPADYARFLGSELTRTPRHQGMQVEINKGEGFALGWGLGWGFEQQGSRVYGWQWGSNPGYRNFVQVDWQGQRALAVFTNSDSGQPLYQRIWREYTGQEPLAFLRL